MVKHETIDGFNILIGESAKENSELVKAAHQNDLWFHLAAFPSCHLILESKGKTVASYILKKCGMLVKENSRYRDTHKIDINYAPIKQIKLTQEIGEVIIKVKCKTVRI